MKKSLLRDFFYLQSTIKFLIDAAVLYEPYYSVKSSASDERQVIKQ